MTPESAAPRPRTAEALRARVRSRARELPPWVGDAALIVLIGVPTVMDAWWNAAGTRQADALTYTLALVPLAALTMRRRAPLLAALVCGLALTALSLLGHRGELLSLPLLVALYTVAVQGTRSRTVRVGAVAAVWSGALGYLSDDPLGAPGGSPMLEALLPLVPLVLGEAVRGQRDLTAAAEAEREREAERRVAAERARMAREVHDILAHTLTAVNVQTAAAAAAFDADPVAARASLDRARGQGRAAVTELRAALRLLRDGAELGAPAPGLDQLDALVRIAQSAGLDVSVEGDVPTGLPRVVEVTAFRVVQEAVTNTIRHASAHQLAVRIRATSEVLEIDVRDNGIAGASLMPSGAGSDGFGLIGMRERVQALGGRLTCGPCAGGGYRVTAQLPTSEPGLPSVPEATNVVAS